LARNSKKDAEETRKAILASARHLFGTKGFNETTIAEICARSGHTKGALFHHFTSKEALFEEIWTDLEVSMDTAAAQKVAQTVEKTSDPYTGFLAGCRVFIDHVSQAEFQQIVRIDGPAVLGMQEWIKRDAGMGMRNLGGGLKFLASQGLIEENNRYELTVLIYGALQGIAQALSSADKDKRINTEDLFGAFEKLVRSVR